MKLAQKVTQKAKLNQTLRNWLPILQASSDELKDTLEPFIKDNPFAALEITPKKHTKNFYGDLYKNSISDTIESSSIYKESLYEKLYSQINSPLFPTQKSIEIANLIVECINNEGYFEWDDHKFIKFEKSEVERIRLRFAYLEPTGVGALDYKESFIFQLDDIDCDDKIYTLVQTIINDFENLSRYTKQKYYEDAIKIIKKFKNPPAIEYLEDDSQIIPDIFVFNNDNGIEIKVNDEFYPDILID
ncbi:RNA polymerase factor sigma-54, partial [Campylobacter fetus]|nr:RNA polymerase factor sigma-54 [Campylobacter fetus]